MVLIRWMMFCSVLADLQEIILGWMNTFRLREGAKLWLPLLLLISGPQFCTTTPTEKSRAKNVRTALLIGA